MSKKKSATDKTPLSTFWNYYTSKGNKGIYPKEIEDAIKGAKSKRELQNLIIKALQDDDTFNAALNFYNKENRESPIEASSINRDDFKDYLLPLNAPSMSLEQLEEAENDILSGLDNYDKEQFYKDFYPEQGFTLGDLIGLPYNKGIDYKNDKLTQYLLGSDDKDRTERQLAAMGFYDNDAYDTYVRQVMGRIILSA